MPRFKVVELTKVFNTFDLLGLKKKMHSIDAHSFKVASIFRVANYLDDVSKYRLQTASFFHAPLDLFVMRPKRPLEAWHLFLDPSSEVEGVVKDLTVLCRLLH